MPPPPPERRGSSLSHPCVAAEYNNSGVATDMRYRYRDGGGGGGPGGDQVEQLRSYRVEDTPINFSTSTSLSDLTLDEPQSGRISVDSVDGLVESKKQRKRSVSHSLVWVILSLYLL